MKKHICLLVLVIAVFATSCNNSTTVTTTTTSDTARQDSLKLRDSTDVSNPDAPSEPH